MWSFTTWASCASIRRQSTRLCSATVISTTAPGWAGSPLSCAGRFLSSSIPTLLERRCGPVPIPNLSRQAVASAGFEIVETRQPTYPVDGSLLVTGEVERTTNFEVGFPGHESFRNGEWVADAAILDDQAVVVNVRGKGLVVLSGCGHSGIINILRYACRLTGVERVHAVMGGFHLSGAAFEPGIPATVTAIRGYAPEWVVPMHCTGWKAVHAIASAMPEQFIQNSVGTTYTF